MRSVVKVCVCFTKSSMNLATVYVFIITDLNVLKIMSTCNDSFSNQKISMIRTTLGGYSDY